MSKTLSQPISSLWKEGLPGGASFLNGPLPGYIGVLLLTSSLLVLLMSPLVWDDFWGGDGINSFRVGGVAGQSIKAPKDFIIEDTERTTRLREAAAGRVKQVFRLSNQVLGGKSGGTLGELFSDLDILIPSEIPGEKTTSESFAAGGLSEEELSSIRKKFELRINRPLSDSAWGLLSQKDSRDKVEAQTREFLRPILKRGVITNKNLIDNALLRGGAVLVRDSDLASVGQETELYSSSSVIDIEEAVSLLDSAEAESREPIISSLARIIARAKLQPNLRLDVRGTEKRRAQARDSVRSVSHKIARGDLILSPTEVITSSKLELLKSLHTQYSKSDLLKSVCGLFLLSLIITSTVFLFTISIWPSFKPQLLDLLVIAMVLVGSIASLRVFRMFGDALGHYYENFFSELVVIAGPLALGGILLEVILGGSAVFLFTMTFALLAGVFFDSSSLLLLMIIMGNIAGAVSVKNCPRRSLFVVAGLRVAAINALIVGCFLLLRSDYTLEIGLSEILAAIIGGVLSGIIAAALVPIFEYVGSYITDMKLMELASLDRPLLRELSVQAPGTWNHSMVMGQMAEAAAEAIGANNLLARVGAYYHDIGKMKNANYFIENQAGKENKHEKLAPSMSALIIKAHVKNGIEMAKQHRLPRQLVDFIREHHGTARIEFFYDKAVSEAEEGEAVEEANYRYGGPRPQTRESGILMLADAVEASSRTLSDPTPAKIQGLVQKMINRIFSSGELEESELTLRDLHLIAKEFTRVLQGIHHRRVEYSEPAEKGAAVKQESSDKAEGEARGDSKKESPGEQKQKLSVVNPQKGQDKSDRDSSKEAGRGNGGDGGDGKKSDGSTEESLKRLGI